ncbi:MAG: mercuric reductase [Gemmatimonadales bacterium]|nr:mercuric reductase [Gemmatimonadales bacterium]
MTDSTAPLTEPAALEDEFERERLANVRPPGWIDPDPKPRYHLVVLGGGTAGLVTASIAAGLGATVALVERHRMGGDCLNVGCVPSKAIIAGARSWQEARESRDRFAGPPATGSGDVDAVLTRMRRIRARISRIDGAPRFRDLGIDVFLGDGRFTAPDRIEVAGRALRFRRAVIATGSRAAVPDIPGLGDTGYLTNESFFEQPTLPARLLVIGGGPIGCELAQACARLGTRVTLVGREARLLPKEGPEAADIVERALRRDGVRVIHQARVTRAMRQGEDSVLSVEHGGAIEDIAGNDILVATGRAPTVSGLGLEEAGVRASPRGVEVDDRLRTSNSRVFAAGDVCSRYRFTHAADAQARLVVANALFRGVGGGRVSRLVMSWVTYTSPEVAHVGLTAAELHQRGTATDAITIPMHDVDRAVLDGEEDGFFRVLLARGSDRILGATLVAPHAGEMIGEIALAMTAGLGLGKVGATIHPYPTQAEVFRKAADAWRRGRLTPAARRGLRTFFRIFD